VITNVDETSANAALKTLSSHLNQSQDSLNSLNNLNTIKNTIVDMNSSNMTTTTTLNTNGHHIYHHHHSLNTLPISIIKPTTSIMSENKTILTLVSNGINSTLKGININKVSFVFMKKYFNRDKPFMNLW